MVNSAAGFIIGSILMGVALAMDAFGVIVAAAVSSSDMKLSKGIKTAAVFGAFQTAMPVAGWILVHYFYEHFVTVSAVIPYIAFAVLVFLGIRVIYEYSGRNLRQKKDHLEEKGGAPYDIAGKALIVLGLATSLDALSVGLTIASYNAAAAVTEAVIIGLVTFGVCSAGAVLGKRIGILAAGKASVVSGIILIILGIEILISNMI